MPNFTVVKVVAICQRHPRTGRFIATPRPHSLKEKAEQGFLMLDCPVCGRGYVRNPVTAEWWSDRKLTIISEIKEMK